MKIEIKYCTKTERIKEAFSNLFPFLKIEFFKQAHLAGEGSGRKLIDVTSKTLGEIAGAMKEGDIIFFPETTTADLEQLFRQKFGLSVQVFRKQKNTWIETTHTDHLSLKDQNENGRLASARPEPELRDRYLEEGQY